MQHRKGPAALARVEEPSLPQLDELLDEGFYQGDPRWRDMRLKSGHSTLIQKGCLLSAVASGLRIHDVRLPQDPQIRQAVQAVLDDQIRGDATAGFVPIPKLRDIKLDGELNPGLLNAWLTANNAQGFETPHSLNISLPRICRLLAGCGASLSWACERLAGATLPTDRDVWQWLSRRHIVIVHLDPEKKHHANHWVLLTGYDSAIETFYCWDPGYGLASPGTPSRSTSASSTPPITSRSNGPHRHRPGMARRFHDNAACPTHAASTGIQGSGHGLA